jgi:membrane-associated phospholipid phosphatase
MFCNNKLSLNILIFSFIFSRALFSEDTVKAYKPVPFVKAFYHLDKHIIGSFEYNYGLNYIVGSSGSYGIIKSGFDWKWERYSYNNNWVSNAGMPSVAIGGLLPLALPLGMYIYGRNCEDTKLQLTGLAIGQAAMLGLAISSSIKAFTGRRGPEILNNSNTVKDFSNDFKFGFLRRGAFQGWPSSHTTVAFAMATTLIELYPDNLSLRIISLSYASLIGLGVSTNIHWFSDAFAGAFIGYAIGKSVGRGFKNILDKNNKVSKFTFYVLPTQIGINYQL